MSDDQELARQVEGLTEELAAVRARTESVRHHAVESDHLADIERHRTDSLEDRADAANHRAGVIEQRIGEHAARLGTVESRLDVDEALLAALQTEGHLHRDHAEHLKEALRSARTIATAMGIVMAIRQVDETEAFTLLSRASQNGNRKLRELAGDLVRTGDVQLVAAPEQVERH